jgi:hypothetical protein
MARNKGIFLLWAMGLVALCNVCFAKTVTIKGADSLSKGELENLSVRSSGELVLGPRLEAVEGLDANFVWDIAQGPAGTLYVATGSPAAIYKAGEGEAELLHELDEQHVLSIVTMEDGSVLAATAPGGVVYRMSPDGEVTTFCKMGVHYVWDMIVGGDGRVYCATGPGGELWALNGDGSAELIFTAAQSNLMCLAMDPVTGMLFFGTQPDGLVYGIGPGTDPTILYDAPEDEVHTLTFHEGALYAGTAGVDIQESYGASQRGEALPQPHVMLSEKTQPLQAEADNGEDVASQRRAAELKEASVVMGRGRPASSNSIYKIEPGTGAARLVGFRETVVMALAHQEDMLLVGTGVEGRMFGVNARGVSTMLVDLPSQHISAMLEKDDGSVVVGSSNPGGLWRVRENRAEEGQFRSEVIDVNYLSHWGRLSGVTGGDESDDSILLRARVGNVSKPDDTWSEWSEFRPVGAEGRLELPLGRFVQVEAKLTDNAGSKEVKLYELSVSYKQTNRPPEVNNIGIDGNSSGNDGGAQNNNSASHQSSRKDVVSGTRKVFWDVSDPNGDTLSVTLLYRGVNERTWKVLESQITEKNSYEWDTRRVPDGRYLLKIEVSDCLSRPEPEVMRREQVTRPFAIDNGRPFFREMQHDRQMDGSYVITGVAGDECSPVRSLSVSRNSGEWMPIFPEDGVFDSTKERFSFPTGVLEAGEHVFVFNAIDLADNVGAGKVTVTVE